MPTVSIAQPEHNSIHYLQTVAPPQPSGGLAWRVIVRNPFTFAITHTLTPDNADITGIPKAVISGDGDVMEGEIVGLARSLNIPPRSIIDIDMDVDGTLERVYRGQVVKGGAVLSPELSTYGLTGLRKACYEIDLQEFMYSPYVPPGQVGTPGQTLADADIGAIVRTIVQHRRPVGVNYDANLIPDLGFSQGQLQPNFNTFGDVLDGLAELVPGFTVLPGSPTYVYDGKSYGVGAYVPPVTWGVNKHGFLFFRRNPSVLELNEWSDPITAQWNEVDAEQLITAQRIILGRATELGRPEPDQDGREALKTAVFLSDEVVRYGYAAGEPMNVSDPLTFMKIAPKVPNLVSGVLAGGTLANLIKPNNAEPLNIIAPSTGLISFSFTRNAGDVMRPQGFVIDKDPKLRVIWRLHQSGTKGSVSIRYNGDGADLNGLILAPDMQNPTQWTCSVWLSGVPDEVYRVRNLYMVEYDTDVLRAFAESRYHIPPAYSGTVKHHGALGVQPAPFVRYATKDGAMVGLRAASYEYRFTKDDSANQGDRRAGEVVIHLEQEQGAEGLAIKALIDQMTKDSMREAAMSSRSQNVPQYRNTGTTRSG